MKKYATLLLFLALALSATFVPATAKERSPQDIARIAKRLIAPAAVKRSMAAGKVTPELKKLSATKAYTVMGYDDGGFAIIANDDANTPVVGYSADNLFATDNPALSWYLSMAEQKLNDRAMAAPHRAVRVPSGCKTSVSHLVESKWDQGKPYNSLCPKNSSGRNCVTGCVATAMAQILYYHKYPTTGKGTNFTFFENKKYMVDYSQATYNFDDLLPDYYNFVRGVVDSADVTLNISRETLQQNRQLKAIAKRVEKKITADLEDMRDNDRDDYVKFFENFGRGLKYGIYSSYGMKKDELAGLLLFWSAKNEKYVTLQEYAEAMPEGQKAIYYAAGDSRERLAKMPVVKGVLDRGYDVLLLTQDVDEFTFQAMREYVAADMPKVYEDDAAREAAEKAVADGAEPEVEDRHLELKNVATGDLDLATDDEKKEAEDATKENEDLFSAMKDALGDKVEKVAVSARLTDAPACITTEGPLSLEMEKVLQKGPEGAPDGMPKSQRVLELNAKHPVFDKLVAAQKAGDADKIKQYSGLLYDQALLVEGILPEDPVAFAAAICNLM